MQNALSYAQQASDVLTQISSLLVQSTGTKFYPALSGIHKSMNQCVKALQLNCQAEQSIHVNTKPESSRTIQNRGHTTQRGNVHTQCIQPIVSA